MFNITEYDTHMPVCVHFIVKDSGRVQQGSKRLVCLLVLLWVMSEVLGICLCLSCKLGVARSGARGM